MSPDDTMGLAPRPAKAQLFGSTGLLCHDCRQPHQEYSVESALWNRIMRPDGKETDREYLCLACFHRHVADALDAAASARETLKQEVDASQKTALDWNAQASLYLAQRDEARIGAAAYCWVVNAEVYDDYNVDLYDSLETAVASIKARYGEAHAAQWTLQEYPDHNYKLTGKGIGEWSIERRAILTLSEAAEELERR